MDFRSFNDLSEIINREYFFKLFGIPLNRSNKGIDLIDRRRRIAVELKGATLKDGNCRFKLGVHQIYDYHKELKDSYRMFWAFMAYELAKPIEEIEESEIEHAIVRRELWITDWNYIFDAFVVHDDELFQEYGANGKDALWRMWGLDNPYQKRNPNPNGEVKKSLTLQWKELYLRQDRGTQIYRGADIITLNTWKCESLIDAFTRGPYRHPKQLSLFE